MAGQTPLVRQWLILRMLCARHYGATVKELADELGVSQKTIRRALDTFTEAGIPVVETVEDFGRKKWRIDTSRFQAGLAFTFDEAIALYLGRRLLDPLAGTLFWDAAQRAFRKIRACLDRAALDYIDRFAPLFQSTACGSSDYSQKTQLIDELLLGIEESRAVQVTYQSLRATEPVSYLLFPYGMAYHRGALYVVGRSPRHRELRHWKVNRMLAAEITERRFERPPDFDLQQHLSKLFGVFHEGDSVEVRVRFAPEAARYVEESLWHPSQQTARQPDGSVVASYSLDGTEEIKRWILSFGRHARVLEPEKLKTEIADEVRAVLQAEELSEINM